MNAKISENTKFTESLMEKETGKHIKKIVIEFVNGDTIPFTEEININAIEELINQTVLEKNGTGFDLSPTFHNEVSSWITFNKDYLINQGEKSYFVDNSAREIVVQGINCALRAYRINLRAREIAKVIGVHLTFKEIKSIRQSK